MASKRLITVKGNAQERGAQLADQLSFEINSLLEQKKVKYAPAMNEVKSVLECFENSVKTHTPICYQEIVSLAKQLNLDLYDLLLLSFEYEAWLEGNKEKCTGFYSRDTHGRLILGQTNDEDPEDWFSAKYDKVIHLTDENNCKSFIYTHPGIPAYMGMNCHKLVVLWQYVDNAERNLLTGVPTTAIIRELLTKQTLSSAMEFLKNTPLAVPNNFILAQEGCGGINVECTPSRIVTKELQIDSFCHANHFLTDSELIKSDIGVKRPDSTSLTRQSEMESRFAAQKNKISIDETKNILKKYPITYERTLASMVFLPSENAMHILFKGSSSEYEVYKL